MAADQSGESTFGFLTRRIGPVPVWMILVAFGIGFYWWESRKNGNSGLFGGILGSSGSAGTTAGSSGGHYDVMTSTGPVSKLYIGPSKTGKEKEPDNDEPLGPPKGLRPLKTPIHRGHRKASEPHKGDHDRHNHENRRNPGSSREEVKTSTGSVKTVEKGTIPAGTAPATTAGSATDFIDFTEHRPLGL